MKNESFIVSVHKKQNMFNGDLDFIDYFIILDNNNNFTIHRNYDFNKLLDISLINIFRKPLKDL
jgi:hypothetical protein